MKKVMITLFFIIFYCMGIFSCPECNIHNYLYSSLDSSENVFMGKIIRIINNKTAQVEVLDVFRGNNKKGEKINIEFSYGDEYILKEFIFSDPVSMQPNFPILQKEFEDEVLFLLSKEKKINNVKQAVKLAMGISTETKRIAFEYLKKNHKKALKSLIIELERAREYEYTTKKRLYNLYIINNLIEAILLENYPEVEKFILQEINNFAKKPDLTANFGNLIYPYSYSAEFLSTILINVKKYENLEKKVKQIINENTGWYKKSKLSELTYAVLKSEFYEIEFLENLVKKMDDKNYYAVGLYYLGNYYSSWWDFDKALLYYKMGLKNTYEVSLTLAIENGIKKIEEFKK